MSCGPQIAPEAGSPWLFSTSCLPLGSHPGPGPVAIHIRTSVDQIHQHRPERNRTEPESVREDQVRADDERDRCAPDGGPALAVSMPVGLS